MGYKANAKVSAEKQFNDIDTNYYVFKDGHSYWGMTTYRHGEVPIVCTKEVHNMTVEQKVEWHTENS